MVNLLKELRQTLEDGHTLDIKQISDYYKDWNKESSSEVKHIYNIYIRHKDISAGIYFSKYASIYKKKIEDILNKRYNGKIYITCTSECGHDLEFSLCYLKTRQV